MLDRGRIIESVLIMLGNTDSYNDNAGEEYEVASKLLEQIIRQVKLNTRFLFNAVTVNLNLASKEKNFRNEYKYYVPVGMVNIVSPSDIRLEGEYIYSKHSNQHITYCKEIRFEEIPIYMENVLRYLLGREMCLTYSQYERKIGEITQRLDVAIQDLQVNEISGNTSYLEMIQGGY